MNKCFILNPEKKKKLAKIRVVVYKKAWKPLTPMHSNSAKMTSPSRKLR